MEKWIKLEISAETNQVDAITDYLVGIVQAAVETRVDDKGARVVLNAFLERQGRGGEEIEAVVDSLRQYLKEIGAAFHGAAGLLSWELVDDQDWASSWQQYFTPFAIIPGLVIAPTWERYEALPEEKVIVMDPGMAFGTGHHATTSLCLELMAQALGKGAQGKKVLDVGTGTGILAMAAALFGSEGVLAIDNDHDAVEIAGHNIEQNGLSAIVDVAATPLAQIAGGFFLVVANIVHDVIVSMIPDLVDRTSEDGVIVISGLIHGEQSDSVTQLFAGHGFTLKELRRKEEWAALLFQRGEGQGVK